MNKIAKYIIIGVAWLFYLIILVASRGSNDIAQKTDENTDNSPVVQSTENITTTTSSIDEENTIIESLTPEETTPEVTIPILYADDENINLWLNQYNNLYPNSPITSDDYKVYYHHGSEHKDQIKLNLDEFPVVLTSTYKKIKTVITCSENGSSAIIRKAVEAQTKK